MTTQQPTGFPLPSDLPQPVDDGAADHLGGLLMPQVSLRSTAGRMVDLSDLSALTTVLYCYPMTGVPGKPLPEGWDLIPGAARLHSSDLELPGSPSGVVGARDGCFRREHSNDRISTGDGRQAPS